MTTTILEVVPALHETELRRMPRLTRQQRMTELERLAEDFVLGVPPSPTSLRVQLAALACSSLRPEQALAKWGDFLDEYRRWVAVEAGEPYWRDLEPGLAEKDMQASLADLLDATDTYRGERCH